MPYFLLISLKIKRCGSSPGEITPLLWQLEKDIQQVVNKLLPQAKNLTFL
jgi:hypothetical protein